MNNQRPTHQAMIAIVHSGEKNKRVVIHEDFHRFDARSEIDLQSAAKHIVLRVFHFQLLNT